VTLQDRGQDFISDFDLAWLPEQARRYLHFMHVPGRPFGESLHMRWRGSFRPSPRASWKPCRVEQWNTVTPIARSFRMRMPSLGPMSVTVDDTYACGRGRMRARLLGTVPVVDQSGPELDAGELVTWLNDAVLFAPTLLMSAPVTWRGIDTRIFELSLADAGRKVSARVWIDEDGAPFHFSTTDRFLRDPYDRRGPWVRARWSTPIDGWAIVNGRPRPTGARALWHLPQGEFAYAEIDMATALMEYGRPDVGVRKTVATPGPAVTPAG